MFKGILIIQYHLLVKNTITGLFFSSSLPRNEIWAVKINLITPWSASCLLNFCLPFLLTYPPKIANSNLQIFIWVGIWKSSIDLSKLLNFRASLSLSSGFKFLASLIMASHLINVSSFPLYQTLVLVLFEHCP